KTSPIDSSLSMPWLPSNTCQGAVAVNKVFHSLVAFFGEWQCDFSYQNPTSSHLAAVCQLCTGRAQDHGGPANWAALAATSVPKKINKQKITQVLSAYVQSNWPHLSALRRYCCS